MTIFLGIVCAAIIVCGAIWWIVRPHIFPPISASVVADGLHIGPKRNNLHNVSISVNGRPWVDLGDVVDASVLEWKQVGLTGNAPQVQQISILGQAGTKWFEWHSSFGQSNASPEVVAEYESRFWQYIDPAKAEQVKSTIPAVATAATPDGP